jgi:two-component system cell cycle sensor histidine kinase/response regulator CckA
MVYNILKNHKGTIFCKSGIGEGTTFDIYFPVAVENAMPEREQEKSLEVRGGKETLLVIDDEENILSLASKILPRYGYSVSISQSGEEGLGLYRNNWSAIDLVLIDVLMPGMNGTDCLRNIFEINPEARVLMMSGEPVDTLLEEDLRSRISGTLYKPFDFSELLIKIRHAVDTEEKM